MQKFRFQNSGIFNFKYLNRPKLGKIFELFRKLENLPILTCAIPGIRADHNDLVSTCSGTNG